MDFNGLYIQVEPTNSRSSPPSGNGWIYNINITINPFSLIWNITPRNSYKLDRHTYFGDSIRTTTPQAVQKIKKAYSAGKSGSWDVRWKDLWDLIDLWVVEAFRFCDAFWWTPRVVFLGKHFWEMSISRVKTMDDHAPEKGRIYNSTRFLIGENDCVSCRFFPTRQIHEWWKAEAIILEFWNRERSCGESRTWSNDNDGECYEIWSGIAINLGHRIISFNPVNNPFLPQCHWFLGPATVLAISLEMSGEFKGIPLISHWFGC